MHSDNFEDHTIMVCGVTHAIQRNEAESDFYLRVLPPAPTDEPQMVMMAGAVDSGDENQPVVAAGEPAAGADISDKGPSFWTNYKHFVFRTDTSGLVDGFDSFLHYGKWVAWGVAGAAGTGAVVLAVVPGGTAITVGEVLNGTTHLFGNAEQVHLHNQEPLNDGFLGVPNRIDLPVGEVIDRIGGNLGDFACPAMEPPWGVAGRALPPEKIGGEFRRFRVVKPIKGVLEGPAGEGFGFPGGAPQLKLPKTIGELLEEEFLIPLEF